MVATSCVVSSVGGHATTEPLLDLPIPLLALKSDRTIEPLLERLDAEEGKVGAWEVTPSPTVDKTGAAMTVPLRVRRAPPRA